VNAALAADGAPVIAMLGAVTEPAVVQSLFGYQVGLTVLIMSFGAVLVGTA
jgi:hypothetical protein